MSAAAPTRTSAPRPGSPSSRRGRPCRPWRGRDWPARDPTPAAAQGTQLGAGHRVVALDRVALLLGRPVDFRDLGLERDDAIRPGLGIADAGERLQLYEIVAIGLAVGVVLRAL